MRHAPRVATGYRPRRFDDSPLFRIVRDHFLDFRESYHRNFSDRCGRFRDIATHTVNRFLLCGDPREGIARYECPRCNESVAVPFSCKTRLFCPTCHEIKTIVWIDAIQAGLLLPVAHRFWTFSIPKRLRYYFMRNRKLMGLTVAAAANTMAKSLADGKLRANFRPGIVALIQTHSDSLDWNSHLHLIVTDGAVDYSDVSAPVFKPCKFWNFAAMTELFRFDLIEMMAKHGVLTPDVAEGIVAGALAREESRGAHSRTDFPTRDDKRFLHHTLAHYSPEGVRLGKKNVTLGKWEPKERKY